MRNVLLIVAGLLAVAVAGVYGGRWLFRDRPESPETLAHRALSAPTEREQEEAAVALSNLNCSGLEKHLRSVLEQSQTPGVRAACIQGLRIREDYGSVEMLFEALEDPSPLVQGRAAAALTHLLGRDHFFRPNDPPERRKMVIAAMRVSWEQLQESPLLVEYRRRQEKEGGER
jgi:HEAT repeat protein